MHANWQHATLGDVCEVQNGFAFESARFSRERGFPLIRIRDLKTGVPSERFDGDFDPTYVVKQGDLLVGMDGEFRCYRWNGPSALLNQRVCRLLPRPELLDADFLLYSVNSHLKHIEEQTGFTTVKHLSSFQVLAIGLPIPPLAEQRLIAEGLAGQLAAVERARRAAAERVEVGRGLRAAFLRAVFDGGEATRWPRQRLSQLCTTTSGGTPSRGASRYFGGSIPWVKSGELNDGLVTATEETLSDEGIGSSSAKLFPAGTLLIALYGATVGKLGILGIAAATNQAVCGITCGDLLVRDYLFHYLLHIRAALVRSSFGGAQPNISQEVVRAIEIPTPPIAKQAEVIASLRARIASGEACAREAEAELTAIQALPAALLREAFAPGA